MENTLVSIIIPVYNVEKYIDECIESVINQTYKNLEIILIDDGSNDKSAKLCDNYAEKDKRIIVIHKENGGLASARNAGIDIFKGEYVLFLDSDDYIDLNCIEKSLFAILDNSCDIVCFYGTKFGAISKQETCFKTKYTNKIVDGKTVAEDILCDYIGSQVVKGLYKAKCIKQIRFPIGMLYEDIPTTYKFFYSAKNVLFLDENFYFYRMHHQSISHTKNPKVSFQLFKGFLDHYIFSRANNLKCKNVCLAKAGLYAISCIYYVDAYKLEINLKCEANAFIKENFKALMKSKYLKLSRKVVIFTYIKLHFLYKLITLIKK